MPASSGLRRALPVLAAIAFAASACNLGPPGVDCGPLSEVECAKAEKAARQTAQAHPDKTIWAIHLRADRWDVIFTDGTRTSVIIN
jgi:hypothetical protein